MLAVATSCVCGCACLCIRKTNGDAKRGLTATCRQKYKGFRGELTVRKRGRYYAFPFAERGRRFDVPRTRLVSATAAITGYTTAEQSRPLYTYKSECV